MTDEQYKLLMDTLGEQIFKNQQTMDAHKQATVVKSLIKETLKFRDKLKEETGHVLSIDDTQKALKALETHLDGKKFPKNLTPEQKALAQILIDTVILFKHGF